MLKSQKRYCKAFCTMLIEIFDILSTITTTTGGCLHLVFFMIRLSGEGLVIICAAEYHQFLLQPAVTIWYLGLSPPFCSKNATEQIIHLNCVTKSKILFR